MLQLWINIEGRHTATNACVIVAWPAPVGRPVAALIAYDAVCALPRTALVDT